MGTELRDDLLELKSRTCNNAPLRGADALVATIHHRMLLLVPPQPSQPAQGTAAAADLRRTASADRYDYMSSKPQNDQQEVDSRPEEQPDCLQQLASGSRLLAYEALSGMERTTLTKEMTDTAYMRYGKVREARHIR